MYITFEEQFLPEIRKDIEKLEDWLSATLKVFFKNYKDAVIYPGMFCSFSVKFKSNIKDSAALETIINALKVELCDNLAKLSRFTVNTLMGKVCVVGGRGLVPHITFTSKFPKILCEALAKKGVSLEDILIEPLKKYTEKFFGVFNILFIPFYGYVLHVHYRHSCFTPTEAELTRMQKDMLELIHACVQSECEKHSVDAQLTDISVVYY